MLQEVILTFLKSRRSDVRHTPDLCLLCPGGRRAGGHGRGISNGKGTGERNGMERRGGNMTSLVGVEAEENTTIKPILANTNKSSGEIVQCAYFSGDAF